MTNPYETHDPNADQFHTDHPYIVTHRDAAHAEATLIKSAYEDFVETCPDNEAVDIWWKGYNAGVLAARELVTLTPYDTTELVTAVEQPLSVPEEEIPDEEKLALEKGSDAFELGLVNVQIAISEVFTTLNSGTPQARAAYDKYITSKYMPASFYPGRSVKVETINMFDEVTGSHIEATRTGCKPSEASDSETAYSYELAETRPRLDDEEIMKIYIRQGGKEYLVEPPDQLVNGHRIAFFASGQRFYFRPNSPDEAIHYKDPSEIAELVTRLSRSYPITVEQLSKTHNTINGIYGRSVDVVTPLGWRTRKGLNASKQEYGTLKKEAPADDK